MGLGMKVAVLPKFVRHVLNHIFHVLGLVGAFDQRVEARADFHLAARAHFAVVHFHFDAEFFQNIDHRRAQVLPCVDGGNGRVAAFDCGAVAGVLAVKVQAAAPRAAFGGDFVTGFVHGGFKFHAVKHEKFGLGAEKGGVAQAR